MQGQSHDRDDTKVRLLLGTANRKWSATFQGNMEDLLTMLAVTAPLIFPNPIAIPSVTLRLYVPSTLLATQALEICW
jgi:hypothetical protein